MKTRRILLLLVFAASVATAWPLYGERAAAQKRGELSPQEKAGKELYLKGEGGEGGEITALLGTDGLEVPASSFSCANCHGLTGQGGTEGGLQPPPLNWSVLMSPHKSALTGVERRPYTEETLARAIRSGLGPTGLQFHPGMPRYRMTANQMSDLVAYLKKIGTEMDMDRGLDDASIKVGAALPLTGPLASVGEDIRATLAAFFAEVNEQGGVYGRHFDLVVEDSRGEGEQTVTATRHLIEQDGVFALVGSFESQASERTNDFIARSEVPLIGPVTLSPRVSLPPNRHVFYLLPTFSDQARALADFVASRKTDTGKTASLARIAIVSTRTELNSDAIEGLKAQARMYSIPVVSEQTYEPAHFSAASVVAALTGEKADCIFFFGNSNDFTALGNEIQRTKLDVALLSSVAMVGRGAFNLPESVAAQTFLSYPASLPDQTSFAGFLSLIRKRNVALRSPAFQSVAYAAAKTFVEATKLGRRQLSREALINGLEQLRNFETGVVPPVTFGPNRRVGVAGSYVVGIDFKAKQYLPLTQWLVPKDKP